MIQWLVAAGILLLGFRVLISVVPRMMAKPFKGGNGAMIGLMMIFARAFDPAKAAAIEQLDRKKETGNSENGASGAPAE